MSRPIVLTDEIIREWMGEFEKKARSVKMDSGRFTYTQEVEWEGEDKVKIIFTPVAYLKMITLVFGTSDEIAWHGIVDRRGDDTFVISDILVYPQEVTGSTVNTDQEEYTNWMTAIPMDTFNRMHMQGHSHVNMQTSPSVVDLNHQEAIVSQLNGDHFYIFMIWNKRLEHNIKVYDFKENTLYEDKDCIVSVEGPDLNLGSFLSGAKAQVKRKSALAAAVGAHAASGSYGQWNRGQYYGTPVTPRSASDEVKSAVSVKSDVKKSEKKKDGGKKKDLKSSGKPGAKESAQQKLVIPTSAGYNKALKNVTDYDSFIYGGMSR